MPETKPEGVLGKVRKLVGLSAGEHPVDLNALNAPWHLARCSSTIELLPELLRTRFFLLDRPQCCEKLRRITALLNETLESAALLESLPGRTAGSGRRMLEILRDILMLVQSGAELVLKTDRDWKDLENTSPELLSELQGTADSAEDMAMNMLHHAAELLENMQHVFRKYLESRKRELSRSARDRYERARKNFLESEMRRSEKDPPAQE